MRMILWNNGTFKNDFLGVANVNLMEIIGKKKYNREYWDDKRRELIKH